MAIVGWITLCLVLAAVTGAWAVLALNGLGRYNIGGVPNAPIKKLALLLGAVGLGYAWYHLWLNAPFTVSVK